MTQNLNASRSVRPCAFMSRNWGLILLGFLCVSQLILIAGCHRGFYRRQADTEAKRLIAEKHGSRWNSATGDVEIDPMSRMFDPFSADHPPIPPDDPSAHKLMREVDRKPGYPHWHANGDINMVENPTWRSYLPSNEKGQVVLTLSDAYRLALLHSPDLQSQRETLYLSALEVSIQRFGFDSQLFAGFNSFLTSRGRFNSGTGASSTTFESSLGATGGGLQARRLGITGANFVVGLANTILWEFAGNNSQSANSLINFSVIQPLLRGAGRERIMESLTQSERTLLANVRQLERYRRGFYLQIATGRNAGQGTTQNGFAFLNQPGLAGTNVGGYIGLLQQKQQIKNLEFSVAQFESLLKQFRELFEKDRIDSLQVAQFESSVYNQQESLLNSRIAYQNSLDAFKVLIGLPPDVDVVVEDPFLDGFELIDDKFPTRLESIKELRSDVGGAVVKLGAVVRKLYDEAVELEDADRNVDTENSDLKQRLSALLPYLMQTRQLVKTIRNQDRSIVKKDIDQLKETRERRLGYLKQVKEDIESGKLESQVEPEVFTEDSIPTKDFIAYQLDGEGNERSLIAKLDKILDDIDDRIERARDGENSGLGGSAYFKKLEEDFVEQIPDLLTDVDGIILEMALLQAIARTNVIEIKDVDIDANVAFETARCLRRDWMNARTSLVDRWRQIEFFADQLESQVDLVLTGEIGNASADNPFRIRYEDGNLRAGFRFDAPIVRQSERNAYRSAQISYQQARRSYYRFADAINQSLRQTVRNINRDKLLFELNRQNLLVNITQVQLARAQLVQPPRQGQTARSDVLARNLTGAIQGLTGAQNRYLRLWAEYEVLRRNLDFDMGTMELDPMFEWVDPGKIDETIGLRVAAREGVAENDRFCCGMQQPQSMMGTEYVVMEGEQVISTEIIQPEMPATADPMIETVQPPSPSSFESENTFEFDPASPESYTPGASEPVELPPVPTAPKVEAIEVLPINGANLKAAKNVDLVVAKSKPDARIVSRRSSSRSGYLDPFGRGSRKSAQKTLLVGVPQNTPDSDPLTDSTESLKRAFQPALESTTAKSTVTPTDTKATIRR